jgi:hypothetical protein
VLWSRATWRAARLPWCSLRCIRNESSHSSCWAGPRGCSAESATRTGWSRLTSIRSRA